MLLAIHPVMDVMELRLLVWNAPSTTTLLELSVLHALMELGKLLAIHLVLLVILSVMAVLGLLRLVFNVLSTTMLLEETVLFAPMVFLVQWEILLAFLVILLVMDAMDRNLRVFLAL